MNIIDESAEVRGTPFGRLGAGDTFMVNNSWYIKTPYICDEHNSSYNAFSFQRNIYAFFIYNDMCYRVNELVGTVKKSVE